MADSVEILLEATADAAVRRQWTDLSAAGLPSAGHHTGTTNAPHVTVAVAAEITPEREPGIAAAVAAARIPFPLRLGGLLVFGRGPFVLARQVVPDADLLALQGRVAAAVGDGLPHSGPGAWTPHVTLARRMTADQLGRAVALVAQPDTTVLAGGIRRWDGRRKVAWLLTG